MTTTAHQDDTLEREEDKYERERRFLETVRGWQETHTGRLAVLRRNAGETLAQSRGVSWLYGYLPQNDFIASAYFLGAALYAFDRPALDGKSTAVKGSFGATMHRLWQAKSPSDTEKDKPDSSTARRFGILLDADYDIRDGGELPFRLRQTVRLVLSQAKSAGQCWINWPQLIQDLQHWNHPDKYVQKKWAKEFYAPQVTDDTTQPNS
jgi:CRISPR system Cascade subunit CasB